MNEYMIINYFDKYVLYNINKNKFEITSKYRWFIKLAMLKRIRTEKKNQKAYA